ncbi:GNAT family N-acetyltransferase [Halopseudomonas salina]|uniref:N-acetyltransferase n=1 Tax=Halopseudomonas salina TaxID=1323744 RepID=A0ABQ1PYD2_9GAMM|nr:GNAT family N-acetyltransferase [Halopseudomonas salina]GGD06595.1 N-acetyltransferase [Halopseudomonas salina]
MTSSQPARGNFTIQIVRADLDSPEHALGIITLLDQYARDPMGGGAPLAASTRENLISELRKRDTAHVILALVDGQPAGLTNCFEGFSTFACRPLLNIHDVVVAAQHRGKGLSRMMFEEAEALARELGCCKMTLEVLEGNTVAQSAYRAFGFNGYELDPQLGKAMFWEKKLDVK